MKIAIAQLNPTIGDIAGNAQQILAAAEQAVAQGAQLLLTPELSLCGYPPRDLLMHPDFLEEFRPFLFFGLIAIVLALTSLGLALPIIQTYFETGLVPRFPTAILSASIMLLAFLSLTCGLILDSVARGRREIKRMMYLSYPPSPSRIEIEQRLGYLNIQK